MVIWGGGDGDLGGGDAVLGGGNVVVGGGDGVLGDGNVGGGDPGMRGGDGDLWGADAEVDSWDFCLFFQRRRVCGEIGGGIGITGEPTRCTVSVFFC